MAATAPLITRASELFAAILVAIALAGLQVFIGGTRLIFSLPIYGLLGLAGVLEIFSLRRARSPLRTSALFFGYVLARAWFSPVPYLARTDIFSVLSGLVIYLSVACIFTSAPWRMAILLFLLAVALVQVGIGAVQSRHGDNFMLIPFLQRFVARFGARFR